MTTQNRLLLAALASLLVAAPAAAQAGNGASIVALASQPAATQPATPADSVKATDEDASTQPPIRIRYYRPLGQRGINVFEPTKVAGAPYDGFALDWGAAFTQQFQGLDHSNTAAPRMVDGTDMNELADIGLGFNLATANLYLNAQLAPGIRVALESYMSSRHHSEFWVKGGYLQVDESPLDYELLNQIMEFATLRVGHFEVNYGDAHFRRTDNANALFNPFVGNYIADAFATEIGAEVTVQQGPLFAMGTVTNGVLRGGVVNNPTVERRPAYVGKLGFDQQVSYQLRARLTGSVYHAASTPQGTLYAGDRAGSRYYNVLDNSTGSDFRSGRFNPGFGNEVTAFQINPFVKLGGLELFGVLEWAEGGSATEMDTRSLTQYAGDVVYRFLQDEDLYIGGRYNMVDAELPGLADHVSINRFALSGGWFITPSILVKGEYVNQQYKDFAAADIRNGGEFSGFVMEGVVAF